MTLEQVFIELRKLDLPVEKHIKIIELFTEFGTTKYEKGIQLVKKIYKK